MTLFIAYMLIHLVDFGYLQFPMYVVATILWGGHLFYHKM